MQSCYSIGTWWGAGRLGMSARGKKNIVILPAENMFNVVVNGLHGLHRLKGSHRMIDKLKSVKSVKSVDNKKLVTRIKI